MPKGLIAALIAKKAPGKGSEDEAETGSGLAMGSKERAAKALISAINGGDASGVASAFQRMYDACSSDSGDDEYEGE